MLETLGVPYRAKIKTLSKGTREKVQLVLVMTRHAKLYLLDEPIGGVDPASREFILHTIIENRDPGSSVLLSTHLIQDVEDILDGFVFLGNGLVITAGDVRETRAHHGKTLDELFREVFRCF
jgi:ABC-2 type transport system ATP-binding protein